MSSRRGLAAKRKHPENNELSTENESNPIDEVGASSSKRSKPVTEKRLHRYRATMTKGIRDRIERALHQRLYLLAVTKTSNESICREYKVLGNTGNVYTVTITHVPSCTCPDYGKGNLCKHIIFILHRVLKVPRYSPLIYQQALITSELNEIFSKVDAQNSDSQILAEQSIREAYHAKTGDPNVILDSRKVEQKIITKDDECPICFESMINDMDNVIFCSTSCGNNIHKDCFEQWRKAKVSMSEAVSCPLCRVQWKKAVTSDTPSNSNGYLNLAAYATTHNYDEDDDDDDDDEDAYAFYNDHWMFYTRYHYY